MIFLNESAAVFYPQQQLFISDVLTLTFCPIPRGAFVVGKGKKKPTHTFQPSNYATNRTPVIQTSHFQFYSHQINLSFDLQGRVK